MKPKLRSTRRGDVGILDVLALVLAAAIVCGVGFIYYQQQHARMRAKRINCVNQLKQIGLSFRVWTMDNGDKFPMQVSTRAGGTMELLAAGNVAAQFVVMSNELNTPKLLACPNDVMRSRATNWPAVTDSNLSYFVVPEADQTLPTMWLAGDRHLTASGTALKPGLFTLKANSVMGWSAEVHKHMGNVVFADGSVQQLVSPALASFATNTLRDYYDATTNHSFRIAIP